MRITPREFVDALRDWSVLEVVEALKLAEEELGIKAMQAYGPPQGAEKPAVAAEPEEEKEEWTVTLTDAGDKKIEVIKVVRNLLAMGLKESKDLVYATPAVIKEGVSKEQAQSIADQLKVAGGVSTIT